MSPQRNTQREEQLRRAARSKGYRLVAAPGDTQADGVCGYLVIDVEQDFVVLGASPVPFSASLDHVESFIMDGASPRQRRRIWPPAHIAS